MDPLPITLIGNTLGESHRYLNNLIAETQKNNVPFEKIEKAPEHAPIDKIFKIDLASKGKNVDYILKVLKDDDILYVTRALKSKWLTDDAYQHIINPEYLETELYPEMITTAVNKMKHWITLNLNDEKRCEIFYQYYLTKNPKQSITFLTKCSEEFIANELRKNIKAVTPHLLKIFCEKTPMAAKIFYDALNEDRDINIYFKPAMREYFISIKCILKRDPDLYLDIVEKHFQQNIFPRLSSDATKFIITHQKERFTKKPELYTAWLLHVNTLANFLSGTECEELIILLSRSKFLQNWFTYKSVEPFIKRVDKAKRAEFKKKVFVLKDVGEDIKDWPYVPPGDKLALKTQDDCQGFFADDVTDYSYNSPHYAPMSPSFRNFENSFVPMQCGMAMKYACHASPKTMLDKLFDEYRFSSFNKTFFELSKRLAAEPSSENRMFMMLVLVSKTGEQNDNLRVLLDCLVKHCNEPPHVRAAIVRSLVKRASIWRVTDDIWEQLLIFSRGLGLDGNTPEADCNEGLHAVILRTILRKTDCTAAIRNAFMQTFSTLTEYSLTPEEKQCVANSMPDLLMDGVTSERNDQVVNTLMNLIDTLIAYNIRHDNYPNFIPIVRKLYMEDKNTTENILKHLYKSKIGRKDLIRENFDMIQTDQSYVNALKFDTTVLEEKTIHNLNKSKPVRLDNFLRKLSIYFGTNDGLTKRFLEEIKSKTAESKMARPLAILIGAEFKSFLEEHEVNEDAEIKRFCSTLKANAHLVRPLINPDELDWKTTGVKFIANRILTCKDIHTENYVSKLLKLKRTAKLALILSQRINKEPETISAIVEISPSLAFQCALTYFHRAGDKADARVWNAVKPHVNTISESIKSNEHLRAKVYKMDSIPVSIRPEYISAIYPITGENDIRMLLYPIMRFVPKLGSEFLTSFILDWLKSKPINMLTEGHDNKVYLFIPIISRFLITCKDEDEQKTRYESVGKPFLTQLEGLKKPTTKEVFGKCVDKFVKAFKYFEVFLNEEYVSCLPVFENIVKWMQHVLPIEKYFKYYVHMHLNMLCFKSARESIKHYPEVFADESKKIKEGVIIFGEIFGKYIAKNCNELVNQYFGSVVELYSDALKLYITNRFSIRSFATFGFAVAKGILSEIKGTESRLMIIFLNDYGYLFSTEQNEDIEQLIKKSNNKEILFFYNYHVAHKTNW